MLSICGAECCAECSKRDDCGGCVKTDGADCQVSATESAKKISVGVSQPRHFLGRLFKR